MVSVVIELTQEQRAKIKEELNIDAPPTLLICADSRESLKEKLKSFVVTERTPVAALAE